MLLTAYQISRISKKPFSRYLTVAILCSDPVYSISKKFLNGIFFLETCDQVFGISAHCAAVRITQFVNVTIKCYYFALSKLEKLRILLIKMVQLSEKQRIE
jgi:hypothetical protein